MFIACLLLGSLYGFIWGRLINHYHGWTPPFCSQVPNAVDSSHNLMALHQNLLLVTALLTPGSPEHHLLTNSAEVCQVVRTWIRSSFQYSNNDMRETRSRPPSHTLLYQ